MGSWSADPFGNDTAVDWSDELVETDDLSVIAETIQTILDLGSEYIEGSEAEEAIAAADALARLKGQFYVKNAYTESLDNWVENHQLIPPVELIELAIQALDRILTPPSELVELWQDSDDFEVWKNHIHTLKARLQ